MHQLSRRGGVRLGRVWAWFEIFCKALAREREPGSAMQWPKHGLIIFSPMRPSYRIGVVSGLTARCCGLTIESLSLLGCRCCAFWLSKRLLFHSGLGCVDRHNLHYSTRLGYLSITMFHSRVRLLAFCVRVLQTGYSGSTGYIYIRTYNSLLFVSALRNLPNTENIEGGGIIACLTKPYTPLLQQ